MSVNVKHLFISLLTSQTCFVKFPQGPKEICLWFPLSFIIVVLTVGSLIYLQLILCMVWDGVKIYFPHGHPAALHIYWKDLFSHQVAVGSWLKMNNHILDPLLYSILFHLKYWPIFRRYHTFLINYCSL